MDQGEKSGAIENFYAMEIFQLMEAGAFFVGGGGGKGLTQWRL